MTTQWGRFRDFINSKEIGYLFTRIELLAFSRGPLNLSWGTHTIDTYRNLLCRSKFLSHIGRGKYKLENFIPEGLTMEEAEFLAGGDNLSYIERVHKRKEKRVTAKSL